MERLSVRVNEGKKKEKDEDKRRNMKGQVSQTEQRDRHTDRQRDGGRMSGSEEAMFRVLLNF